MAERIISWQQMEKHIYFYNCWIIIRDHVYDVTDFLVQHPGGDKTLIKHSGRDGTEIFENLPHSDYAVSIRNSKLVGRMESSTPPEGYLERIEKIKAQSSLKQKHIIAKRHDKISPQEVKLHKSQENCWIIIDNRVYDVTDYMEQHPGGINKIMEYAGVDATTGFKNARHSVEANEIKEKYYIGELQKKNPTLFIIVGLILLAIGLYVLIL